MRTRIPHVLAPVLAVFMAMAAIPAVATATPAPQDEVSPEEQIKRLEVRVEGLMRQLAAAREEIRRLEGENRALKAEIEGRAILEGPDPDVVVDAEAASKDPLTVLAHLKTAYVSGMENLSPGDSADDKVRTRYLRELTRWGRQATRAVRAKVEWPVRLVEPLTPAGVGFRGKFQMVDRDTKEPIGDPFGALLPRDVASRYERIVGPDGADQIVVLGGIMTPKVIVNPERTAPGAFDNPRFIGPFAELRVTIAASSVRPLNEKNLRPDRPQRRPNDKDAKPNPAGIGSGGKDG